GDRGTEPIAEPVPRLCRDAGDRAGPLHELRHQHGGAFQPGALRGAESPAVALHRDLHPQQGQDQGCRGRARHLLPHGRRPPQRGRARARLRGERGRGRAARGRRRRETPRGARSAGTRRDQPQGRPATPRRGRRRGI
ncbi:MAG: hypothetical protein AVDCRST_MAG88-37, partial [uncultured Thermomicrobiales bacterium]